ncbi:MAG: serine hydrolase, partial [Gammaproteobacteria bacterium]|nr:serine hydrolase [Gammaproteobacteria bacterium]
MTDIHGHCDPTFQRLADIFADNFDKGLELGASVAATVDGELVVDLWGGYRRRDRSQPWEADTVVLTFSSTKFPVNLCTYMLIDQGKLDLDAEVADYWPEFAAKGKDNVTVRHVFTHTAGVPSYDPPIPFSMQYDWHAITARLADQSLWWEPGTVFGYHGNTYGVLLGELVRRITGKTVGQFLKSEIADKIGADFVIGFDLNEIDRLGQIEPVPEDEVVPRVGPYGEKMDASLLPPAWTGAECLTTELPSGNGIGNARSLAQLAAIIAMNGELYGHRFFSRETVDLVLEETRHERDVIVGETRRLGLGLGLDSDDFPCVGPGSIHWGGAGGSILLADRDR